VNARENGIMRPNGPVARLGCPRAPGPVRATYIAALREADNHNITPLLAFARS
jgi:hypothetical protein